MTMSIANADVSRLLEAIVGLIDIPKSYYEKAAARHRSLGEWLQRPESRLAAYDPDVRPQGSFRYGTVNKPLNPDDAYDLDDVCVLRKLGKAVLTQQQLKELYGEEIRAYAKANNMLKPVTEHNRCWRLQYSDEVSFHLDTLPCVPEDTVVIQRLTGAQVDWELARRAVAITDKRHPKYREITSHWPSSNPRGFAVWFERRAALGRTRSFAESQLRASVEDVPPYEWKTTLQRSIQLLKRHRDVMFRDTPDLAPISMIITNLAARGYEGEADLAEALGNIVGKMPGFVHSSWPKVPNPADPAEDYADKWRKDPRLERSFWDWHAAVKADIAKLPAFLRSGRLREEIIDLFDVRLTEDQIRHFQPRTATPAIVKAAPTLVIPSAPKPWGLHA
jgi:cyclic GMP-AMP synthase DncV-like protein